MKKILAIAPYPYLPYFSGGQKFIAKFFEELGAQTNLTVISVEGNDAGLAKSYKFIPLLKRSFSRYYDRSLFRKITTLVQEEKYDAIIWEHPYYGWLAKKLKKATGIFTIIHTHNIEYQRFRSLGKWWWPVLRTYERKCLQRADAVLFITPEDREFAIAKWGLQKESTELVPFGTDLLNYPFDRSESKAIICREHGIDPEEKIFLFNGLLSYKPNIDAVKHIIAFTNTVFQGTRNFRYKILIAGKGLPDDIREALAGSLGRDIIYAGFVENIAAYFKGADIFLNTVKSGGGIKTKMVEAIAYGTTVISTASGAAGMDREAAGNKLVVIDDNDWQGFANTAIAHAGLDTLTLPEFYQTYNWSNIVKKFLGSGIWRSS